MSKQTVKAVSIPEFDASATAIVKAYAQLDAVATRTRDVVNATMQQYIDSCALAGLSKDESSVNKLGKAIRDAQTVLDIVASGAMEKKTFTEYAQSAMRAFFHGVPFEASLKNNPDYALPWGGSKSAKSAKAGKVTTTDRAALDATLVKALEQARALGLLNFAADLVDLCADALDGFSE